MRPMEFQKLKHRIRPMIPEPVLRHLWVAVQQHAAAKAGLKLNVRDLFFDLTRGHTILRVRRGHFLYLQHILENFDYYIDSVIPVTSDGMTLVDMSGPRYHRLRGFADIPFLFPSQTEPYATTKEYLDFARLKPGQTVLDIGAYAGVTSIIFGQLVGPGGHVYAFEADGVNFECAQTNVRMAAKVMGIENIRLQRKAVWSHGDGLLFSNEGSMGSSAVTVTGGKRGVDQVVESVRLQDFFADQGLSRVDFVKMDIEGCEIEVLKSSAGFLNQMNAKLIVEPHLVEGVMSTERCRNILESANYKVRVRDKVGESEPLIEAVP